VALVPDSVASVPTFAGAADHATLSFDVRFATWPAPSELRSLLIASGCSVIVAFPLAPPGVQVAVTVTVFTDVIVLGAV
jgi:hypothetical protein